MTFTTLKPRPSNFYWSNQGSIMRDQQYQISAIDWNRLTQTIQQFETYKGIAVKSFTTAGQNTAFTATMFNEVVSAIDDLNYTGIPPKIRGDNIFASDILLLSSKINSIP